MATEKSSFEKHLEKLKGEYKAQLPTKLESITLDWEKLENEWLPDLIVQLHRNVHSMVGTSGTFGFTELSKDARVLETLLKPLVEKKATDFKPDAELCRIVRQHIHFLHELINPDTTTTLPKNEGSFGDLNEQLSNNRLSGTVAENILIYYLDDELAAPELLIQNLISYGFKSKHFRTMSALQAAIEEEKPSLVILDLNMPDITQDQLFSITRTLVDKDIKAFILSGLDNFQSRLESVRAGVHAYWVKPVDVPSLVSTIRNSLNINANKPAHVLIVDDQESAAKFYASILERVGMYTTIECNPANVLQKMHAHQPDLILLDINMPEANGDELALVIRQFEQYQSIPILFLSAQAEPERKTSLLELGSDDLLSKGMPPEELVRQIRSRVERAKILTSLMYQDSLTGLLNHAQIQLAAERVFQHCKRNQSLCSIAMIDIDKFKIINDSYGHLTGDRVIKALAQLLEQRLRITDYIGRFGGEEFMLVMPDINIQQAGKLINYLRKAFSAIDFKDNETSFNVTFSSGIADSTQMGNFMEQIKMADEALYRAKNKGRNLVCTSISQGGSSAA